jgi:glutaredoxin
MRAYLIVAATLWIACSDATGQAYRWVDDQGRVHYTQNPPPPQAKGVQRKDFRAGPQGTAELPYATQLAAKNYPVTLYTQPDCGSLCDQARAVLVKRSVPFREVSVATQKDLDEVKKVSGGEGLPLVVVGSLFQSGYHEGLINNLLDTAGYPPAGSRLPVDALRKVEPAAPPPPAPAPQGATGGQPSAGYR